MFKFLKLRRWFFWHFRMTRKERNKHCQGCFEEKSPYDDACENCRLRNRAKELERTAWLRKRIEFHRLAMRDPEFAEANWADGGGLLVPDEEIPDNPPWDWNEAQAAMENEERAFLAEVEERVIPGYQQAEQNGNVL
jgi:hypothetical protein